MEWSELLSALDNVDATCSNNVVEEEEAIKTYLCEETGECKKLEKQHTKRRKCSKPTRVEKKGQHLKAINKRNTGINTKATGSLRLRHACFLNRWIQRRGSG